MHITNMIFNVLGIIMGVAVGYGFGKIQENAARRYQKKMDEGKFNSSWSIVPGSMTRTAWLLVVLAFVQLVLPVLFTNGCQWWVSGGVVAGYGAILYRQFRARMAAQR